MKRALKWMLPLVGLAVPAIAQDDPSRYAPEPQYGSSHPLPTPEPRDMSLPGLARQYVLDRAAAAAAWDQWWLARQNVRMLTYRLDAETRNSPELADARRRLDQAQQELVRQRFQALAGVRGEETYRQIMSDVDRLSAELQRLRVAPAATEAQIQSVAEAKLRQHTLATRIEDRALGDSDAYRAARDRVLDAAVAVDQVQRRLDDRFRNDDRLVEAQESLLAARQRLNAAAVQFAATSAAYGQALEHRAYLADLTRRFGYGEYDADWYGPPVGPW